MSRRPPRRCAPWPCEWNGGPARPYGPPLLDVTFEVETKSETNSREEWRKIDRKGKARAATEAALTFPDQRLAQLVLSPPFCVRITRLSAGTMDRSNLPAALKTIEDTIAAALEVDDGDPAFGVTWAQEKRRGPAAVRVEVWGGAGAADPALRGGG